MGVNALGFSMTQITKRLMRLHAVNAMYLPIELLINDFSFKGRNDQVGGVVEIL